MSNLSVEKLDGILRKKIPQRSAGNPHALLFEYVNDIPETGLWVLPREAAEDGRYHVYLNPSNESAVESWVSSHTRS